MDARRQTSYYFLFVNFIIVVSFIAMLPGTCIGLLMALGTRPTPPLEAGFAIAAFCLFAEPFLYGLFATIVSPVLYLILRLRCPISYINALKYIIFYVLYIYTVILIVLLTVFSFGTIFILIFIIKQILQIKTRSTSQILMYIPQKLRDKTLNIEQSALKGQ